MSKQPTIYEINTPIFLRELSEGKETLVTFDTVPDSVWDDIASQPFDMVWFMGVWKRSEIARDMAISEPWLKREMPDLKEEDVIGSAYSILDYHVDDAFGGNEGLAIARQKLQQRGLSLMLDYVPNHVGIDHPWVTDHTDYFLGGSQEELADHPSRFVETPTGIFARGKDPNFEPWSDVLQLNAFSPGLRQELVDMLTRIAGMCDALRCDMAMLMMNEIFQGTWGERAGAVPADDFWPHLIGEVKKLRPDFIFLAEVYWEKERALLEQGFDFCYDKEFYDFVTKPSFHKLQKHLDKTADYQDHLLKFLENHDEERAAETLTFLNHGVAALILATVPGAHLYHEGQFEGRKSRVPVHLSRRMSEEENLGIRSLYANLFTFMQETKLYDGEWQRLEAHQGLFSRHAHAMLVWTWKTPVGEYVFCINFTDDRINGSVPYLKDKKVLRMTDQSMTDVEKEIYLKGTSHVKLAPWQGLIIQLDK